MRIVLLVLLFLSPLWVFAAVSSGLPSYPAGVKGQYVQDCMTQPLNLSAQIMEAFGRRVSEKQRYGYCLCQFNYFQATVRYEDYTNIDTLIRSGQQGMNTVRSQYPWFFPHFQKGVESCGAFLRY